MLLEFRGRYRRAGRNTSVIYYVLYMYYSTVLPLLNYPYYIELPPILLGRDKIPFLLFIYLFVS